MQSVECSAGTYRDNTVTICTKCPENSITEQTGAASCTSCSAGTVSNDERTQCGNKTSPIKSYTLSECAESLSSIRIMQKVCVFDSSKQNWFFLKEFLAQSKICPNSWLSFFSWMQCWNLSR